MSDHYSLLTRKQKCLVQFAFAIQFYLFGTISVLLFLYAITDPPKGEGAAVGGIIQFILIATIIFTVAVYVLFRGLLFFFRLPIALSCMIVFNLIHSFAWLAFGIPFTLLRLSVPTLVYLGLCCCYQRKTILPEPGTEQETLT